MRREARSWRKDILKSLRSGNAEDRLGLNNSLAGYVALKILIGEGADGWDFMLRHHQPKEEEFCPLPDKESFSCPVPVMKMTFPMDLALFLRRLGYIRE